MIRTSLILGFVALAAAVGSLEAQQPAPSPIKRIPLQKFDVPAGSYEAITAIAEISPSVNIGRHTHPGLESGYVVDGDLTLLVEGKPPLVLHAGDSYQIPAGAIHDARSGDKMTKLAVVYVVEKGKPLATPAP
jgi:quercetin dioxygenase-like cupin family protein